MWLLLLAPALAGCGLWWGRRWGKQTAVAATLFASLLFAYSWTLPPNETQLFSLTTDALVTVRLAVLGLVVLCLISYWCPQDERFLPLATVSLTPLLGSVLFVSLTYGAMCLLLAFACLGLMTRQSESHTQRASYWLLIMGVLLVPALLLGDWVLQAQQVVLAPLAGRLLAIAGLIILAGFPFYMWVVAVIEESSPLAVVWILGVAQLLLVRFVWQMLAQSQPLHPIILPLMVSGGAITIAVVGVLAWLSKQVSWGYWVVADMALLLVGIANGTAWQTAVWLLLLRTLHLLIAFWGITVLPETWRKPLICYSALGLIGAGWLLQQPLTDIPVWNVLLAGVGFSLGLISVWQVAQLSEV